MFFALLQDALYILIFCTIFAPQNESPRLEHYLFNCERLWCFVYYFFLRVFVIHVNKFSFRFFPVASRRMSVSMMITSTTAPSSVATSIVNESSPPNKMSVRNLQVVVVLDLTSKECLSVRQMAWDELQKLTEGQSVTLQVNTILN